jgi:asparagine synthase (glutamine-hydrolysing)
MCGIAGHLASSLDNIGTSSLERCLDLVHHRGPDDTGIQKWKLNNWTATLGHKRLSIIDLSLAGHQPMGSQDGKLAIVFNGEIYNYRELRNELKSNWNFLTDTDTEVLLAAWARWGLKCLDKLIGMFAFCVLDLGQQSLTLVRDPFGIKPLFYSMADRDLKFASEIPALLRLHPNAPTINLQRAVDYLVWGAYDDEPETFFDGILQLMPGHCLQVDLAQERVAVEVTRWWWPPIQEDKSLTFSAAVDAVRETFLESVKLHLRSDVPWGVALSGGIDSAAIACAVRYLEPDVPIRTFSYIADDPNINEEFWIDSVNAKIGASSHKVRFQPEDVQKDLDNLILSQGEPFGSTSIYAQYRVFQLAKQAGVTVTLDGQGSDELFAGYDGYPSCVYRSLLEQGKVRDFAKLVYNWPRWPGRRTSDSLKRAMGSAFDVLAGGRPRNARLPQVAKLLDRNRLVDLNVKLNRRRPEGSPENRKRRLSEHLRQTQSGGELTKLLRHGDRTSMRWSIESRVPFLNPQLARLTLSLPEEYLLSLAGQTKYILRQAMRGIVPDCVLDRKDKIGFATPRSAWLMRSTKLCKTPSLSAKALGLFSAEFAEACSTNPAKFQYLDSACQWRIVNLLRWYELSSEKGLLASNR